MLFYFSLKLCLHEIKLKCIHKLYRVGFHSVNGHGIQYVVGKGNIFYSAYQYECDDKNRFECPNIINLDPTNNFFFIHLQEHSSL